MQITTYGATTSLVPSIVPPITTTPTVPVNPVDPTPPPPVQPPTPPATPTDPTPPTPPVVPGGTASTLLPSTMTPVVMDKLTKLKTPTVQQLTIYNRVRKEYYVAQAGDGSNGSRDPWESTFISRLDDNGAYIDQMKIVNAGHGTSMVVENYGTKNVVYIWLSMASKDNTYYRFTYKTGIFNIADLPSRTLIPKFAGSSYATYHVDWEADSVLERKTNSDTTITMKKRKISEVLKGTDHVYASLTTEPVKTQQGWAAINDSVYILQGATNGEQLSSPDPTLLDTYNWSTGKRIDRVNLNNLGKVNGVWDRDTHEPEGLSIYRDATTKKASLILGITTGIFNRASGYSHTYFVYRFSNIGNAP